MTSTNSAGRFGKSGAIAVILGLVLVVPAAAGIIIQNFQRADIVVNDACFTKTAGEDPAAAPSPMTFDGTATVATAGGVNLLQETAVFQAYKGDRMLFTDTIDYNNDCGQDLDLLFISAPDPAAGLAIENMAGMDVRFYLPDAAGAAVPGLTGTWTEMLAVTGGAATDGVTPVTLVDGATLTMAVTIDTDAGATPVDGTVGTVRWIAQADHG